MNRTILRLVRKYLRSKIPFSKFKLSNWLIYHKGFSLIAIVIENNRIHSQIYFLTIGYCSLGRELYVINFSELNSNYKWLFLRLL